MNRLYYGDNLDVLRRHVDDASVDLVYLDPPFNSNASYNVLFAEHDGTKAASQIKAFEDTWEWDEGAARAFEEVIERGGRVAQAMLAFRTFLGDSDMLAYLAMMAPRLVELHRVLKPTGSIYLHCDTTASHYLKMLMDAVFGADLFLNEIIWQRTGAHNDAKRFGRVTDSILLFAKTSNYTFNPQYAEYDPAYIAERYHYKDKDGRLFWPNTATSPNPRPNMMYEWKGRASPPNGWRFERTTMERLEQQNRLYYSKSGMVYVKNYLDEQKGRPAQNLWSDITMSKSGAERLGYPTQKPEALLDRIIAASSNEGDTVLDPFCGCGTAIASAQKLKRKWIGIDITHLAITLIRSRLTDAFTGKAEYEVVGEPVSMPDAVALATSDPYQFQWWALGLVGARPVEQKKGADKGIDGRIYFHVGDAKSHSIILSVKAGHVNVSHVRDLRGVLDREKAEIGVLISLEEPTGPMRKEAASAGFYASPWGKHAKLQLLTVEDLMTGKGIDRPPAQTSTTFKRAPKAEGKTASKPALNFGAEPEVEDTDEPF
jgi:site-specific DNA-methyltransferase (adenine-specific)